MQAITVETFVRAPLEKLWEYWTRPEHITQWNFATDGWHCPKAENDLRIGGEFKYRMAARDDSYAFDFRGRYDDIEPGICITCTLADGRKMEVKFEKMEGGTKVTESFDPEDENPADLQKEGWQAILDNFRKYAEGQVAEKDT
jgi:uncharacterized protein YndB with AHSA1/START domain